MGSLGNTPAGDFRRFVAEEQKTEAMTLKQDRLAREEATNEEARKKNRKDKKYYGLIINSSDTHNHKRITTTKIVPRRTITN